MKFIVLRSIINLLLPRYCESCGSRLALSEQVLCCRCIALLPRTADVVAPYDNSMARMFWARIPVERCAAFMYYQPHTHSANIIYSLKYRNRPDIGIELGRIIATEYAQHHFFDGIDIIIPLPLHEQRQKNRGYNQSQQLSCGISSITGIVVRTDIVLRTRHTSSQTLLSATNRITNMHGAFCLVNPRDIEGKYLLLVDDVFTTGATLLECASVLAAVAGVRISVLTIGRTIM